MAGVGEVVKAAELLGKAGYFIWENTRTTLDINVSNQHSNLVFRHFVRYCSSGECHGVPTFEIKPMKETVAKFKANTSSLKLHGCLIYGINRRDGQETSMKNLYLLLGWKIQQLKDHYKNYVLGQFEDASNTLTRTWSIDHDTINDFTVSVSMTDTRLTSSSTNSKISLISSSCKIIIRNECDELLLCNFEPTPFEGKQSMKPSLIVGPYDNTIIKFKSAGVMFARTSGCLVFELTRYNSDQPLLWGRRTFLAIDALVVPHDASKRKASIKMLTVKDGIFPRSNDSLINAHNDMLSHYMVSVGHPAEWRLDELGLQMKVAFRMEPHAVLDIMLRKSLRSNLHGIPSFLSTDYYRLPTHSVMGDVNDYLKKKSITGPGLVLVDNNSSSGMLIEPIYPAHGERDERFICECDDGLLLQHGYCLHRRPIPTERNYIQQIYAITSKKGVKTSPHRCLLVVSWGTNNYITAVIYTRRDKRSGEQINKLASYFLKQANLRKNIGGVISNTIMENTYEVTHLMERTITLPCKSTANLMTYEMIKSPQLFSISLQDPFDTEALYKDQYEKCEKPKSATPYQLTVIITNKLLDTDVEWVDFVSTGAVTTSGMEGNMMNPSATTHYTISYPPEDQRHALLLRFKKAGTQPMYIDVHIDLAVDGRRPKQTTTVRYRSVDEGQSFDAKSKDDTIVLKTNHSIDEEEEEDEKEKNTVKEMTLEETSTNQFIGIHHSTYTSDKRHFTTTLCLTGTKDQAMEHLQMNDAKVDIAMVKAGKYL
ncbi:hypothetical protein BDF19DRAFT_451523 [Syncephalis fuscata]|nr:hypothetical protein BDF19DRAFT_451523 [Syncephalis fuscata]